MKQLRVSIENGAIMLEGANVGHIGSVAGLEALIGAVTSAVVERCAAACDERELGHRETSHHSATCDRGEMEHKAREAAKCARAIRELKW